MDDIFGDAAPEHAALATSATAYEPNDSRDDAAAIGEGSHAIDGAAQDWFVFEAEAGNIDLTMTPTDAPQKLNMELYNAAGDFIRQGFTPEGAETIAFTANAAATYYLRIYVADDTPPAPGDELHYTLDIDLPQVVAPDGNNTRASAEPLAEGTHDILGREVDWFQIESPSGTISASMTAIEQLEAGDPRDDPRDLNMVLFNAAGQAVKASPSGGTSESFDYLAPSDGTYYLRVTDARYGERAPDGTILSYRLGLDLPEQTVSDGNDSLAEATPIGQGTRTESGTGVDWFRIQSGPGTMDFTMTPLASEGGTVRDLSMELYNSAGESIRSDITAGGPESFGQLSRGTDEYFLKVYWSQYPNGAPNGVTLDYRLEVDLPDGTWSTQLDYGPVQNASVTVYDIDNDGADEIFVATSKTLDAQGNEVRPAGLIVLEDDGSVKWEAQFPAAEGVDPSTGKSYETSSVSTAPVFSDVDDDGRIDILVGTGGGAGKGEFDSVGQPGDKGGLYALDRDGEVLWFHQTRDTFGDDGRSDGVYGAPRVFDIDADGVREVMYEAWDHYFYMLDGRTGGLEREFRLHDTAGATPTVADLDGNGFYELILASDITDNPMAGTTQQGGMLQVLSNYAAPNVNGWMDQIAETTNAYFRGKFEEQSLWSTPKTADLDHDGTLEIIAGTGNFFKDGRGEYIKVWNADGTLRFELPTVGRTLPSPLIADLDGDGSSEIVAATTSGYVHAWSAGGKALFTVKAEPYTNGSGDGTDSDIPIARQPIAVDVDNADGDLEILLTIGSQLITLDSDGTQLTSTEMAEYAFSSYSGSPVAKDLDGDGRLDLVTGGTTETHDQAIVYRWENVTDTVADTYSTAAYQDIQSLHDIRHFVDRFYTTILGRDADPAGGNDWVDNLVTGVRSGADVARGFIFSREFTSRDTSDADYVNTLYSAFFGRPADAAGRDAWVARLEDGATRAEVLNGFIGSREFANLSASYGIRASAALPAGSEIAQIAGVADESSILRGGDGANVIYDGDGVNEARGDEVELSGTVYRLYRATLAREPNEAGFLDWYNALASDRFSPERVAGGFVGSAEFQKTYGDLDDAAFVDLLYHNVLDRAASAAEIQAWTDRMDGGASRASVVLGFSESREFQKDTNADLDDLMRTVDPVWIDVVEGGAGDDTMNGGLGGDIYVFRAGQGGSDVIHGFEPWDELQLSGFGFVTADDAMAQMTQSGADVVFDHGGQRITFRNTSMTEMERVRYNLS